MRLPAYLTAAIVCTTDCAYCGAVRGSKCVVIEGPYKGRRVAVPHAERREDWALNGRPRE